MFARRTEWLLEKNRLSAAVEERRASELPLIDLTISNPTEAGLDYAAADIAAALGSGRSLRYEPDPLGLRAAREVVVGYYRARGEESALRRILLCASTSEGYSFLFRLLCEPGDEVLAPSPSYPLFEFLAQINDVKLKHYQLIYDHGWQIDMHSLREACTERTRAVMVVHPNNPTGSYVSADERLALNELCRERGMAIVADEVFLDYAHDGRSRPSFVANAEALTFTLSGLSKIAGLPQMKLGWVVTSGPEEIASAAMERLEIIADTYLSVNAPVQYALPVLLEQRHSLQAQLRERIAANLAELRKTTGDGAMRLLDVEGGWYAVLRVPATRPDEELAIELLRETGVLVHPGHLYDFAQDGYLIVSLITPEREFGEGWGRLVRFVQDDLRITNS